MINTKKVKKENENPIGMNYYSLLILFKYEFIIRTVNCV